MQEILTLLFTYWIIEHLFLPLSCQAYFLATALPDFFGVAHSHCTRQGFCSGAHLQTVPPRTQ